MHRFVFPESIARAKSKQEVVAYLDSVINLSGLSINEKDMDRPWGGFYKFMPKDLRRYLELFFMNHKEQFLVGKIDRDPKILFIEPNKRLSWQYHESRREYWYVISGPVGVYASRSDTPPQRPAHLATDQITIIEPLERHRLAALDVWALVAEIWEPIDSQHPSDEHDKTRVLDDYGRGIKE